VLRLRVTSRVSARGVLATVPRASVRVARRGWYRLTLCAGPTCVTKPFRARHGRARVPQIVADSLTVGRVKLRLIGPGGQATGSL
jgi:hypothetical protein